MRGACSFTGDTSVLMADGTHKPISEVKIGDQVLATGPETGEQTSRTVTAIWTHQDTVLGLHVEGGATVTNTEDHPYWNASDRAWQRAEDLDRGDHLVSASGKLVRFVGLGQAVAHIDAAYNLMIRGLRTMLWLVSMPFLCTTTVKPIWKDLGAWYRHTVGRKDVDADSDIYSTLGRPADAGSVNRGPNRYAAGQCNIVYRLQSDGVVGVVGRANFLPRSTPWSMTSTVEIC